MQPEYVSNIEETLDSNKITIKDIILSHWHYDHVGGASEILKNVEVLKSTHTAMCILHPHLLIIR